MNLFARAAAGEQLAAAERAFLRLIKSFLVTAFVATWPVFNAFLTAISTNDLHVDYGQWLTNLAKSFVVALVLSIQKYFSAQADAGKGNVVSVSTDPVPSAPSYNPAPTEQPPLSESILPVTGDTPTQVVGTTAG